jgi:hypothetical protein
VCVYSCVCVRVRVLSMYPCISVYIRVNPRLQVEGDWTNGVAAATKCTGDTKFFDPAGLQCVTCAANASVDATVGGGLYTAVASP